jgi:hypothetical protein
LKTEHICVGIARAETGAGSNLRNQVADAIQNLQSSLGEAKRKDLYSPDNQQAAADGHPGQPQGRYQPILQTQGEAHELQRALADLATLDRYELRVLSRRNRAIRIFAAISIVTAFLARKSDGQGSPAATA